MPLEIERKFLLANEDWKSSVTRRIRISDGLIASNNGNKARVRIVGWYLQRLSCSMRIKNSTSPVGSGKK